MKLETSDIILFRNKSILAWLIRLFTRCEYNHAGIVIGNNLVESTVGGVKKSYLSDRLEKSNMLVLRYDYCELVNKEELTSYAYACVDAVKYDYKNLLLYQAIYRLTGLWVGKYSKHRMMCSEFVARCYEPFHVFNTDVEKVSPKEILKDRNFKVLFKGTYSLTK